ncbi:MAG: hypothetical protein AAFY26_06015 [Cyanobacteria bacterium J06638_22]
MSTSDERNRVLKQVATEESRLRSHVHQEQWFLKVIAFAILMGAIWMGIAYEIEAGTDDEGRLRWAVLSKDPPPSTLLAGGYLAVCSVGLLALLLSDRQVKNLHAMTDIVRDLIDRDGES